MTKNIFQVSNEEAKRIRLLHENESTNPAIKSTLTEQSEKIDINVGEMPMMNTQSRGDTKPKAKVVAPCKDIRVAGCPGTTGGYRVCVTIDGQVPTQANLNDKVIYTPCTSGGGGQYACDIGRVIEVCGPGGVGCSGLQNYQMGGNILPQSTVSDCNWTYQEGWRCHPQQGCVDVSQSSGVAQFASEQDCLDSGCLPEQSWNCEFSGPLSTGAGNCVAVLGTGGQYPTQQDCIDACSREQRYSCQPVVTGPPDPVLSEQTQTMQCIPDPMGQYASMADCQADCGREKEGHCVNCKEGIMNTLAAIGTKECPDGWTLVQNLQQGPCYECDGNGNCIGPGWAMGPNVYNSQSECQNGTPTQPACQQGLQDYDCVNNQCTPVSGGQFTGANALQDCQAVCGQQTWKCNLNVGCTQDPAGQYNSQASCETDCCNQTIINWNWPPYQSGNPTCHEICSKLNTPSMLQAAAGNPLNFRHKCRYDWLIAQHTSLGCQACSSSNVCCDNPGWLSATLPPAQQVSSNPYCVNGGGSFIPNVEDAMNGINAQSTPYGCGWLLQAQTNLINQLAGGGSGASVTCNKEGRIAWLDELMTTGNAPGFTANMSTMTALYPNGVFVPC